MASGSASDISTSLAIAVAVAVAVVVVVVVVVGMKSMSPSSARASDLRFLAILPGRLALAPSGKAPPFGLRGAALSLKMCGVLGADETCV